MYIEIINRNVITSQLFPKLFSKCLNQYIKISFLPKTIVFQFSGRYDILVVATINIDNIIVAVICLVFIIYLVLY